MCACPYEGPRNRALGVGRNCAHVGLGAALARSPGRARLYVCPTLGPRWRALAMNACACVSA